MRWACARPRRRKAKRRSWRASTRSCGKKNGTAIDDEAKKGEYTFTADKITIKGMDVTFVMGYKLDPKTTPVNVDMEILEGPEGRRGARRWASSN